MKNRENADNVDQLRAELNGDIRDCMQVLKVMRLLENEPSSYLTKWEDLKDYIHASMNKFDRMQSGRFV